MKNKNIDFVWCSHINVSEMCRNLQKKNNIFVL